MLGKKLKEAIDLLGGKAILEEQGQYYILLSLEEFKKINQPKIKSLTKQELVDKINNEIASWKIAQKENEVEEINLDEITGKENEEIKYEKTI